MSLESMNNKQKSSKRIAQSDMELFENTNEGGFQHFENVNELRLEDVGADQHFDSDLMSTYKLGHAGTFLPTNGNSSNNTNKNNVNSSTTLNQNTSNLTLDQLNSPSNKYPNYFLQNQLNTVSSDSNYLNNFQQQMYGGGSEQQISKGYSQQLNGQNKQQLQQLQQQQQLQQNQAYNSSNGTLQQNSFATYLQQQQQQLSSQEKQSSLQSIGSSTNLQMQKQQKSSNNISAAEVEQQKQQKLITALKSNPQDLEMILEEQEKLQQQQQILQKKLKIESDSKSMPIPKNQSQIELSNYSPTRETIKRVESNTSLNGGMNGNNGGATNTQGVSSSHNLNGERNTSSKNLSKIKGNVKNAYIKKISSLLNLQNQMQHEPQQENYQEPRRADNSDDSDESRSKSDDPTKQEDGKKVMKNRESARNSRHRKKIYIELLEKKISTLQQQIEKQCEDIEKNQKDICKILDNHNHIKAFVQTRHDYIQKIGEMANSEKPNVEQLSYILDSLRGTCRQKAISLYFRTIMKQYMQSTAPYLVYGYMQNISEDQEFNRCVEIFKKICYIQDEQQAFQFLPHLKKFLEIRSNFKESYNRMKKIRKSAFKRQESIEKLLDGLSLLHPTQMGKFLKTLDKFRKHREIRLQRKPTSESAGANDNFEIDQTIFRRQQQQNPQPPTLFQQHQQQQQMNSHSHPSQLLQQSSLTQQQQHQQQLHHHQQQQYSQQSEKNLTKQQQTRQFNMPNSFTNGNLGINGANSNNSHTNGVTHSNSLNNNSNNANHQLNLSNNNNANANNANSLNPFMQMSYPNMMNAASLGIGDGIGGSDDTHLTSQLDLHGLSKPIGIPPSYYYQNQLPIAQQQQLLTAAHKDSQNSQQQQQQQQQHPYQKGVFNSAAASALSQSLKPQQQDLESYYHSQPYKKQFYNDSTNGNLHF